MRDSFADLQYQAAITSSILGGMGKHQRDLANEMQRLGILTEFTATQAGEAMQRLAMAGFTVDETIGAAEATLRLATIGLMEVADAADIAAGVYRGFNYEAETSLEVTEQLYGIVSQLGYAITHSAMMAEDLGESLKFVAASASAVGWTLEDATVGLMVAADNMVRAGIAGRALRMSLVQLSKVVGAADAGFSSANDVIDQFGLQFTDAEGRLKGFIEIVIELQDGLSELSDLERQAALAALFGTRAVTFWSAAMGESREELYKRDLGLKAAAAKEAIFNKLHRDGAEVLMQWRDEIGEGESAITFLTTKMGFTKDAAEDINEVITNNTVTFEEWTKIVKEASVTADIVDERLSTLKGSMILLASSVDALYASFGEALSPVMKKWYDLLKMIADAITKLHPWIRAIIGLLILLGGTFLTLAGQTLTMAGSLAMLMAAMMMLRKDVVKTMSMNQLLVFSFKELRAAAWGATKAFIRFAIRGIGSILLYAAPLVAAILLVQHVFQKLGPVMGTIATAVAAVALAFYYMRLRIWMAGKAAVKATVETSMYAAANEGLTVTAGFVSAAETRKALAIGRTSITTRIATFASNVYTGAQMRLAAAFAWVKAAAFSASVGFSVMLQRMWAAVVGSQVLKMALISLLAVMGALGIGLLVFSALASKQMEHSVIPDAFESGSMHIQHSMEGLSDSLSATDLFSGMKPSVPVAAGAGTPVLGRRPVVIAPSTQITYQGGITLGGDERTLKKMKDMVSEGIEDAVKKSLLEAERSMREDVWK